MQPSVYHQRRQRLLKSLGEKTAAILPGSKETFRNADSTYPFRQNSDFYYLTGFNEPDAVAVFIPNREQGEFVLFNRKRDPNREVWDGPRVGQEGAVKEVGADQAFAIEDCPSKLASLLQGCEQIYYDFNHKAFDQMVLSTLATLRRQVRHGVNVPKQISCLEEILHEMRLIKDDKELELMAYAAKASAKAHCEAMRACKPGMKEYQLAAILHYHFQTQGCQHVAYSSIVAGGGNGCVLHYVNNNDTLQDGDLVLIDAGGEYQNYAADITRTFPVNGKFSNEQKAIYNIVLTAQEEAIKTVSVGNSWHAIQDKVVEVMVAGLLDLKLLKGTLADNIENKTYEAFYMHLPSHWLGLDVHDAGHYKIKGAWRPLQAGMTLTVEPGIYIPAGMPKVDKKWWNIGVRIEDDVCVTDNGPEVLSADAPKTVIDIEALMESQS